ncbi:MAG: hypothetical protein A2W93_07925 [Bacteroidetes bacterium GWF2_43_63]|nr:MAG: hypothetical protein A2W94_04580 [Bacteroidetes bacterium GWE2_42_42]OFY55543.1 MAG: hypothetical protein A2W93_07925 [Bacteroidetes bacterium GWF2_43_63]HBG71553.1 hypothetical protein [Bacteroidales bacterium]HCB62086.1 hypothetical protein [Bacteroidales bacterium]HCY22314.1 hypothetical protein [Bacteroidales bacterium]
MNTKFLVLLLGISIFAYSCGNDKNAAIRKISPPVAKVDMGTNVFSIDPTKDTLLTIESGSTIFIPANSLTGADNKPYKGKAQVEYEEYMNQAEVILSGIPMQYDSAGETHYFESAGMFTIDAETPQGEKLKIADGKSVTVSQASPWADQTTGFNFYQFDTVAGKWRYLTTQDAEPLAPEPPVIETEENASINVKKNVRTVDDFVFDINVNYTMYKELADMKEIMWKFSGNKKYSDPEKEQWIFDLNWPDTQISRDESQPGAYVIVLKSTERTFKTSVVPVPVDPSDKADVIAQADKSMQKLGEQTASLIEYSNVYRRTMEISSLGTCNWDLIFRFLNPKRLKIRFFADGNELNKDIRIYQVLIERNVTMECTPENAYYSTLLPTGEKVMYVAVNEQGEAYVGKDVGVLLRAEEDEVVEFELQKTAMPIKSREDLNGLICQV